VLFEYCLPGSQIRLLIVGAKGYRKATRTSPALAVTPPITPAACPILAPIRPKPPLQNLLVWLPPSNHDHCASFCLLVPQISRAPISLMFSHHLVLFKPQLDDGSYDFELQPHGMTTMMQEKQLTTVSNLSVPHSPTTFRNFNNLEPEVFAVMMSLASGRVPWLLRNRQPLRFTLFCLQLG
jgi:hypothetical protein